jgi:hypothetical protein
MAKHAHTEIPEIDPHSPEGVIEMLRNWEQSHLAKIDAKQQNIEFGIVAGEMQKIGERCNRRLVQATSGTCGGCHKPLANVRIFNQVSVFNRNTGKFDEMYACSSKCSDKLIDLQHKNAVAQQQES